MTQPYETHDVVVVGAGIGGLAAATALAAAGRDTVVLEGRGRVGGRVLSIPAEGGAMDLGASWFWDNEPCIAQLAEDLGVESFPHRLVGDTMFQTSEAVQRYSGNLVEGPSRRFVNGTDGLARGMAARLPARAVRLNTPVTAIRHVADGLDVHTADSVLRAGHVVLAVPPALAVARIDFDGQLPTELAKVARFTPVWMGAVAKVLARYPRPFWREAGLAGAGVSRVGPLQEMHDISGPDGAPAVLFGFAPTQLARRTGFEDQVRAQLAAVYDPAAGEPTELLVQDWGQEEWTSPDDVHRLTTYQLFGHDLYQQPTLDGRLHWGSTETAPDFAGHVEGALIAAERAAHAVLSG
ncbi:flavin monoamine oxidase family protein [Streptomyces sp. NPDC004629]|uniref:flavin monoamine oxidase family protein n=1 Tax=Streptomyces sp. NPDC004629 TaxID=3364705 RepID=UPI0036C78C62